MKYFQDLEKAKSSNKVATFVLDAIFAFQGTDAYARALCAERYDIGDTDILRYKKFIYNSMGQQFPDLFSANNKLPSNLFGQLVTMENSYSLANGINFADTNIDKQLGAEFDGDVEETTRASLLGGKAYMFVGDEKNVIFKYTEFVPLYDENTGELKAGIRFFKLDTQTPLNMWLYEIDGYTYFRKPYKANESESKVEQIGEKQAYKIKYQGNAIDGFEFVGTENYSSFPIVEMKANKDGVSEIFCVKAKIDAYDRTLSGLQNDLDENQFMYWLISNNGGMDSADLAEFLANMRTRHGAVVESSEVQQFTKDIPTTARETMLDKLKSDIYQAMSCVDTSQMSSGAVNEMQINAMYANMDNKASEFEKYIRQFVQQVLALKGIEVKGYDITFIRNKLQSEQEQATVAQTKANYIMQTATEVGEETVLNALKKAIPEYSDIDVNSELKQKDIDNDLTREIE